MGTIACKDTRRISFDNTFALTPSLSVAKALTEDHDLFDIGNITTEEGGELLFKENKKSAMLPSQDDDDMKYWSQRIDYLKKEHELINQIVENEYKKKLDSTNKTEDATKTLTQEKIQKIKPCFEYRSKIVKCYEDNPHQPLMCSEIIQAFSNCVAATRFEE